MLEQALNLRTEVFEKLVIIIWRLWKNSNAKLWADRNHRMQKIDGQLGCFIWLEGFQKARKPGVYHLQSKQQRYGGWSHASTLKLNGMVPIWS